MSFNSCQNSVLRESKARKFGRKKKKKKGRKLTKKNSFGTIHCNAKVNTKSK